MMIESLHSSGTNITKMINFFRAHTRASVITITLSWAAFCAFVLIPNWREGLFYFLFLSRPLLNADCQPGFLGRLRRRPWSTIHPRETAARLAYGHRDCYLSFPLRLQHTALRQPLGNSAGRFD